MDPQAEIYIQNLVNQYYCDLSSNRQAIAGKYYDPQARMTYQDAFIQGSQGIHEKLCTLAFQNLQISVTGINIQPVMDGIFKITTQA
ncbi:hypothetical protein MXB_1408 [Myxobolus squamalis]|nr:hypothetical protein MXB_1408 [Myxobolus squamalis]